MTTNHMDNQPINEPNVQQGSQIIWTIVAVVVITAIIVGVGVWWWQKASFEKERQELQEQIDDLEQKIKTTEDKASAEQLCLDNDGEYVTRDNFNYCVFPDGKECDEFGYNKCVEAKGHWTPEPSTFSPYSDWGGYKNEKYGFEVLFPEDWSIDQNRSSSNEIVFDIGIPGTRESIKFETNQNNLSLDQIKSQKFQDESIITNESQLTIGGETAKRIDTSEFDQKYIIFLHNNIIYTITTTGHIIENQILSTFKFIE